MLATKEGMHDKMMMMMMNYKKKKAPRNVKLDYISISEILIQHINPLRTISHIIKIFSTSSHIKNLTGTDSQHEKILKDKVHNQYNCGTVVEATCKILQTDSHSSCYSCPLSPGKRGEKPLHPLIHQVQNL